MPLTDGAGRIAYALKHISYGILGRLDNHACIARCHVGARLAPCILTREQGVAGWGTGGSDGVGIGEANTLLGQFIYVRSLYVLGTITSQVAVAEVSARMMMTLGFC